MPRVFGTPLALARRTAIKSLIAASPLMPLPVRMQILASNWQYQLNAKFIAHMKRRSMLHEGTLLLLDFFARRASYGILEIGAYIGGATAVVAKALQESGSAVPFVTVEVGGSHPHPELPSDDITRDLRNTLTYVGVQDHVRIVEGLSEAPATIRSVASALGSVDLFIIDAEGRIGKDFDNYGHLLKRGAIIVCDDFIIHGSTPAPEKQEMVNPWIEAAVKAGRIKPLGIFLWGTWFGVYRG
jgi:predicted O-methyltransferase YrrM